MQIVVLGLWQASLRDGYGDEAKRAYIRESDKNIVLGLYGRPLYGMAMATRQRGFIRESDKILRLCAWQVKLKDEHRAEAKQAFSFSSLGVLGF